MNRKSLLTLVLSVTLWTLTYAQNPVNMRSNGMGGVGIGFQDINSIFTNQAGMARVEEMAGIASAERRFQLSDLNTYSLGVGLPTNAGVFGLSVNYFGFEAFNQQKYGLVYARKLLPNFSVGAEMNLHNFQILEYGSTNTLSFEFSLQYQIMENLTVGAKMANPIERDLANGEHLPTEFQLGFMYQISDKIGIAAEFDKQIDFAPNINAGIEYQLIDILYLRAGIATNPSLVSFGLGVNLSNGFKMDIATSLHQQLGWTPGLSFIYQKPKKRKK